MAEFEEKTDYFESYDETKLFYRTWLPKRKKKRAVFIGIHGAAVHSGRMIFPGQYFSAKGYPFYAFDKRGHGHWDKRPMGHINSWRQNIFDIKSFIEFVKDKEQPERSYLVGHSMGGTQVLIFAIDYPDMLDAVVASSPVFRLNRNKVLLFLQKLGAFLLVPILPKGKFNAGINQDILTRDPEVTQQHKDDPLRIDKVTARWAWELEKSISYLLKNIHRLTIPTFFLVPGDDRLVDSKATMKKFGAIEQKAKMKLKLYEDYFHENFNEPPQYREQVFKDMEEFLGL